MKLYQNGEVGSKKKGVVLQPTGGMENVKRTILQSVYLDDLQKALTEEQYKCLEQAFPSKRFLAWGCNDYGWTDNQYKMINKGFDIWFYTDWCYFLRAEVECGFHNPKVASLLWNSPSDDSRNFNNLYFCSVDSLTKINLLTPAVNEITRGELKKNVLRRLEVFIDEKATALLKLI
ncbi:hypothetical protein AT268_28225 [Bacillus cereus]|uniref:Uncharacterized protein n=1 Tax=Bacillus cereus TaxID=1396 RepID=A0A9X0MG88_BACCE|nr:hypothetical protein [Bacillus cereus]KXY40052.1 hypothetical protein AT268_28225 [Bacillus cereus]